MLSVCACIETYVRHCEAPEHTWKIQLQQATYEARKLNIEDVDVCWVVFQQQGPECWIFYQQPGVFYRKQ